MLRDSPKVTQLSSKEETWSWTVIPTLVVDLSFPLNIAPLYKGDLAKKAVELGQCRGQNETGGCRKQSRLHTHRLWQVTLRLPFHAGLRPNLPVCVGICSSLLQHGSFLSIAFENLSIFWTDFRPSPDPFTYQPPGQLWEPSNLSGCGFSHSGVRTIATHHDISWALSRFQALFFVLQEY